MLCILTEGHIDDVKGEDINCEEGEREDEEVEVAVVPLSNTVSHPGAVMVEALYGRKRAQCQTLNKSKPTYHPHRTQGAIGPSLSNYKDSLESTFKKKTHIALNCENKLIMAGEILQRATCLLWVTCLLFKQEQSVNTKYIHKKPGVVLTPITIERRIPRPHWSSRLAKL